MRSEKRLVAFDKGGNRQYFFPNLEMVNPKMSATLFRVGIFWAPTSKVFSLFSAHSRAHWNVFVVALNVVCVALTKTRNEILWLVFSQRLMTCFSILSLYDFSWRFSTRLYLRNKTQAVLKTRFFHSNKIIQRSSKLAFLINSYFKRSSKLAISFKQNHAVLKTRFV